MEFKETFQYPASIDRVWEMLSDPEYAADRAKELRITAPSVDSDAHENKVIRTTTGGIPQDEIPAAVKKFISPSAKATLKEVWERHGNERISGGIEVSAQGVPAHLNAHMELAGKSDVTDVTMRGELRVNIPLLGRRLEKEAIGAAPLLAKAEVENAQKWLAAHK